MWGCGVDAILEVFVELDKELFTPSVPGKNGRAPLPGPFAAAGGVDAFVQAAVDEVPVLIPRALG